MKPTDEVLMAYVDGELDPAARSEVEAAMRADPQIDQRVAQHRALRARVQEAYAPQLEEPVPARLLETVRERAPARIVDLGEARAARLKSQRATQPVRVRRPYAASAAVAASVLIGVGVGLLLARRADPVMIRAARGALVASGPLAAGLTQQIAGERPPDAAIAIGMSFVAKSGDYCRTFTIVREGSGSGVACRRADEWQIELLTRPTEASRGATNYRLAASDLPPAVLEAVEQSIAGDPLDRDAEVAARGHDWHATAPSRNNAVSSEAETGAPK